MRVIMMAKVRNENKTPTKIVTVGDGLVALIRQHSIGGHSVINLFGLFGQQFPSTIRPVRSSCDVVERWNRIHDDQAGIAKVSPHIR